MKERLVLVGNGMAGMRTIEELLKLEPDMYDITVFGAEPHPNYNRILLSLVAPLFEQAKVCANHLAHLGYGRYQGSVTSTKLKVTGVDLFSAGNFQGGEGCEEILLQDPSAGVYKKLVIRDDRVEGAVLYGDTVDGAWYFQLMREGVDISDIREDLLFGSPISAMRDTAGRRRQRPWGTTCRSVTATVSARARSSRRLPRRAFSPWTTSNCTPRRRRPAAPARGWSNSSWRAPWAATTRLRSPSLCAPAPTTRTIRSAAPFATSTSRACGTSSPDSSGALPTAATSAVPPSTTI